jgi:hypothetical protein
MFYLWGSGLTGKPSNNRKDETSFCFTGNGIAWLMFKEFRKKDK